ncbi:MAG: alpha/beta hydrolase [Nocardioidaceae bacterium]
MLRDALGRTGLRPGHRPFTPRDTSVPSGPPSLLAGAAEARAAFQVPRLLAAGARLSRAPRGDGGVVVDVPGWLAAEATNAPLRRFLGRLGHDARGWGLGVNHGRPERDALLLAEIVLAAVQESGRPVALVGWSLGGLIAREVAREHPEAVRRVVTYGTPVVGGPTHTVGARRYGPDESQRITRLNQRLDAEHPIQVPVTAILSRRDGIVSWRACLDRTSRDVEHVEVRSTHLGMGLDPDVWSVVADRLSGP